MNVTNAETPWALALEFKQSRKRAVHAEREIAQADVQLPQWRTKLAEARKRLDGFVNAPEHSYTNDVVERAKREFDNIREHCESQIARIEADRRAAIVRRDECTRSANEAERRLVEVRAQAYPTETARVTGAEQALAAARAQSAQADADATQQSEKLSAAEARFGETEAEADWKKVLVEKQNSSRLKLLADRSRKALEACEAEVTEARLALEQAERAHAASIAQGLPSAIQDDIAEFVRLERALSAVCARMDATEAASRSAGHAVGVEVPAGAARLAARAAMLADRKRRGDVIAPADLSDSSFGERMWAQSQPREATAQGADAE